MYIHWLSSYIGWRTIENPLLKMTSFWLRWGPTDLWRYNCVTGHRDETLWGSLRLSSLTSIRKHTRNTHTHTQKGSRLTSQVTRYRHTTPPLKDPIRKKKNVASVQAEQPLVAVAVSAKYQRCAPQVHLCPPCLLLAQNTSTHRTVTLYTKLQDQAQPHAGEREREDGRN